MSGLSDGAVTVVFAFGVLAVLSSSFPTVVDSVEQVDKVIQQEITDVRQDTKQGIRHVNASCSNGTLTAYFRNTGDALVETDKLTLLVDGVYEDNYTATVIGSTDQFWEPGADLRIELNTSEYTSPYRVLLATGTGEEAVFHNACASSGGDTTSDTGSGSDSTDSSSSEPFTITGMAMFKYGYSMPSNTTHDTVTQSPVILWNKTIGPGSGMYTYQPTIVNGTIYLHDNGDVYAVSAKTGGVEWKYNVSSSTESVQPAIANGTVFTINNSGVAYALNASTGDLIWKNNVGNDVPDVNVIAYNDTVYAGLYNGEVVAVDADTGKQKWLVQPSTTYYEGGIGYTQNRIIVSNGGGTWGLYPSNGSVAWSNSSIAAYYPFSVHKGDLFIPAGPFGEYRIVRVDPKDGSIYWHGDHFSDVSYGVSTGKKYVYTTTYTGDQFAYYLENGSVAWHTVHGSNLFGAPVYTNGTINYADEKVYVNSSSDNSNIVAVDTAGESRLSAVWKGNIYASSAKGYLYRIAEQKPYILLSATGASSLEKVSGNLRNVSFGSSTSYDAIGEVSRFGSTPRKFAYIGSGTNTIYIDYLNGTNYNSFTASTSIPYATLSPPAGDHDQNNKVGYYFITKQTSGNPNRRSRNLKYIEQGGSITKPNDGVSNERGVIDVAPFSATHDEIVFVNSSYGIAYYNSVDGTVYSTGAYVNGTPYYGEVADYNGDGTPSAAYLADQSGELRLVTPNGTISALNDSASPDQAAYGAYDYTGDGNPDVIYPSTNGWLKYVTASGDIGYVRNVKGERIPASSYGVATHTNYTTG